MRNCFELTNNFELFSSHPRSRRSFFWSISTRKPKTIDFVYPTARQTLTHQKFFSFWLLYNLNIIFAASSNKQTVEQVRETETEKMKKIEKYSNHRHDGVESIMTVKRILETHRGDKTHLTDVVMWSVDENIEKSHQITAINLHFDGEIQRAEDVMVKFWLENFHRLHWCSSCYSYIINCQSETFLYVISNCNQFRHMFFMPQHLWLWTRHETLWISERYFVLSSAKFMMR